MWLTGLDLKQISWEQTGKMWFNLWPFKCPPPPLNLSQMHACMQARVWRCCTSSKRERSGCEFLVGVKYVMSESGRGPVLTWIITSKVWSNVFTSSPYFTVRVVTVICRQRRRGQCKLLYQLGKGFEKKKKMALLLELKLTPISYFS